MKLTSRACLQPATPNLTVVPLFDREGREGENQGGHDGARLEAARKIEQSIAFMTRHFNQPLHVARLAKAAHISPSHFFVLFKRWTGFSPIDYLIRLRMREACRLLGSTALSVKEIAAEMGYEDPFYFSRVFKAVHGLAPTDYRLMMEHREVPGPGPGAGKSPEGQPAPISDLFDNNDRNERLHHEKDRALRCEGDIYLLQ
jgi:AraC-like DNA-binding protein